MQDNKLVTVTLKLPLEQHSLLKMIVAKKSVTLQQHIAELIAIDMRDNWGYSPENGSLEFGRLFKRSEQDSEERKNEN